MASWLDFRAIAFYETKFAGRVANATNLETPSDQLSAAQINHELNVSLDAMEKTNSVSHCQAQLLDDRIVRFRLRERLKICDVHVSLRSSFLATGETAMG